MHHKSTTSPRPPGSNGRYTPEDRIAFAEIRAALRRHGLPDQPTPRIAAAIELAALLRRARAIRHAERQIAHGIAPLPE